MFHKNIIYFPNPFGKEKFNFYKFYFIFIFLFLLLIFVVLHIEEKCIFVPIAISNKKRPTLS